MTVYQVLIAAAEEAEYNVKKAHELRDTRGHNSDVTALITREQSRANAFRIAAGHLSLEIGYQDAEEARG